ncbi:MAG: 3-methyl-2-oxobutanoate dehydrogenase subunit VorB [Spirochaetales bacterium]|nr:3-methyl-2-oxobutanoate dehydrogenase subunit VorB [Spirochaetales bacterium]
MGKTVKNEIEKVFIKGNHAVVEAAIAAGCRFYAGYPITPQNEIPQLMSKRMPEIGGTFIQAESELISINFILGAGAAGARALTTSSSPGISLMMEGLSYMAGAEIPGVIVNVQRGGPGLGNIAPAQSDYYQAVKPGHGDFHMIVLGPHNTQDMFDYAFKAFDLADKYRIPVIILADGLLGQLMENITIQKEYISEYLTVQKDWALTGAKGRNGRRVCSLRMKPGGLEEHVNHLQEKYNRIKENEIEYETFNVNDDTETLIVAFGTAARISKGAISLAGNRNIGLFRPITLWPFPSEKLLELSKQVKQIFVFELNLGQMLDDVKIAVNDHDKINFYGRTGGGIFTPEELFNFIQSKDK